MATHSGILAYEVPWTEEIDGLGHELATKPPPPGERCCIQTKQYIYRKKDKEEGERAPCRNNCSSYF